LLALRRMTEATWSRVMWVLAWAAAIILTLCGLAQTVAAQPAYAGVFDAAASADDRRLLWRAFVWDPWFVIWTSRRRRPAARSTPADQPPAHG